MSNSEAHSKRKIHDFLWQIEEREKQEEKGKNEKDTEKDRHEIEHKTKINSQSLKVREEQKQEGRNDQLATERERESENEDDFGKMRPHRKSGEKAQLKKQKRGKEKKNKWEINATFVEATNKIETVPLLTFSTHTQKFNTFFRLECYRGE